MKFIRNINVKPHDPSIWHVNHFQFEIFEMYENLRDKPKWAQFIIEYTWNFVRQHQHQHQRNTQSKHDM